MRDERVPHSPLAVCSWPSGGHRGTFVEVNHHVEFPGDPYARLVWAPVYRASDDEGLREFINWLGRKWFDFCETEVGPSDDRIEGDDLTLNGGVVITSSQRIYRNCLVGVSEPIRRFGYRAELYDLESARGSKAAIG